MVFLTIKKKIDIGQIDRKRSIRVSRLASCAFSETKTMKLRAWLSVCMHVFLC